MDETNIRRHRFLNAWDGRTHHEESKLQNHFDHYSHFFVKPRILDFPGRRYINVDRSCIAVCGATSLFCCLPGWRRQKLEIFRRLKSSI